MNLAWPDVSVDPVLRFTLRAGLSLLVLSAAAHKLRDFRTFVAAIDGYAIVPTAWSRRAAALFVAVECLVGGSLVLRGASALPALVAATLLGTYTIAIAVNLWRGRLDLACGCGGPVDGVPIGLGLLGRNLALCAACLFAALPASARALTLLDAVTAIGLLGTFGFMYAAVETALANGAKLRQLSRADADESAARLHLREGGQ